MKKLLFLYLISCLFLFAACGGSSAPARNTKTGLVTGVQPVADPEVAVIEMENGAAFGTITIELYSNIAPKAVAQFKTLAKEGVYNGTTFHRINPAVIQGGDPLSKDDDPNNDGTGSSNKPNVPAEFSDIPYDAGIVGAARNPQSIHSANSQFFITLKREPAFDKNYTIFGKVIDGMNNVRTISGVTPKTGLSGERPVEPIRIKSITFKTQ
jgi:peptidylprolyl isomerase